MPPETASVSSDPTRLVRRQEHRDRRYIVRLSGPPERRPLHSLLLVIVADDAHRMCTLSIDQARLDRVDANFPRAQLLRQHAGHRVDRAFRGGVDDRIRRSKITHHGADIDDAAALVAKELRRLLCRQQQAQDKLSGYIPFYCQFFGFKPPSSDGKRL